MSVYKPASLTYTPNDVDNRDNGLVYVKNVPDLGKYIYVVHKTVVIKINRKINAKA